jgi:chemotaxis family two-component system response regulator Rcp1
VGHRQAAFQKHAGVLRRNGDFRRWRNMTPQVRAKSTEILLVEDNPGDVRLTLEALKEDGDPSRLSVARDGAEAMEFLRRLGRHSNVPRPDLIILDLNLPKRDGREVLAMIKSDRELKRIPVVVLTTSKAQEDIAVTYNLHANCYITKPIGFEQFITVVKSIKRFWLTDAKLPPE